MHIHQYDHHRCGPLSFPSGELVQIVEYSPEYLFLIEHKILNEAYKRCEGSKTRMSELLSIPLPTLKSKLKKLLRKNQMLRLVLNQLNVVNGEIVLIIMNQ